MNSFIYNGEKINYKIKRSKRKTIGIKISPEEGVTLSVPMRCNEDTIKSVLNTKASWILSKLKLMENKTDGLVQRQYVTGEQLMLLGDYYKLSIIAGDFKDCSVKFNEQGFKVYLGSDISEEFRKSIIKMALDKLYRDIAKRFLKERTEYYASILKVNPNRITIKEQKSVWGSCSSKSNINYNWRIIMAPAKIVDYLVVHELCHLRQPNHSEAYWNLVEAILPDYKERKNWLKENGIKLNIDKIASSPI
jgi:predicted metal-dependent hydrolase